MFDGDIEAQDEFESAVTTSIQKALSTLWCSYKFPFRYKKQTIETELNETAYTLPHGNIARKTINNKQVYCVKLGNTFLSYEPDCEVKEAKSGQPEYFYIDNDEICFYPTPDKAYEIEITYLTMYPAVDSEGNSKATLTDEDDCIDIPGKYEVLFLNALMPLAMTYAIASLTDENYAGYEKQFNDAYKILIDFTKGIDIEKRIGWR